MYGIEIFISKQREQNTDDRGADCARLFAHGRKGEKATDNDDVEIPIRLQRVRPFEIKLNQFVVIHKAARLWGRVMSRGEEKSVAREAV